MIGLDALRDQKVPLMLAVLIVVNGKIVAQSEAYTRPSDARKGARAVIRAAQVAYIEEK